MWQRLQLMAPSIATLCHTSCRWNVRVRSVLLAATLLFTLTGCAGFRGFGWRQPIDPLAGAPRPRWADDPQVEEVVDHLNRNVEKLQAWRANRVRISANRIPLSGMLAVERGKHLRLEVSSPLGSEVDIGSNDDLFWVWAKRMPPPEYVYCRHEHTETVRQAMGIPFEPEWLMQALGVAPLSSENTKLEIEPNARQARLVQQVTSAHGHPLRKVIRVDLPRGLILEHSVYDYNGQLIASARLDEHQLDRPSGVVMPRRVKLDWPQSDMSLVMHLGQVEINPKGIPSQVWDMPKLSGYQVVDLGAMVQAGTRVADRGVKAPVEMLQPEFDGDENTGSVKLTNDESDAQATEETEEGLEQELESDLSPDFAPRGGVALQGQSAPVAPKKPIPRDWWNE